jgi:hypothetical protein
MPSLNSELQFALNEAVLAEFGVLLSFSPMKRGEYVANVDDMSRPTTEVRGTIRHETQSAERHGRMEGPTARLTGPVSTATVAESEFANSHSRPRIGDKITVNDGNFPAFAVSAIHADGKGRLVFTLEKISAS